MSEAFYNNAWHMLDSDIGKYYLMSDNRTIPSIAQLHEDQALSGGTPEGAKNTVWSFRNKAIPYEYIDALDQEIYTHQDGKTVRGWRYFFKDPGYVYVQEGYDRWTYEPHSMAMTLRPNETLIRNWNGAERFYDYKRHIATLKEEGQRYRTPVLHGDGQLIWKPDLSSGDVASLLGGRYCAGFAAENGTQPAIHVREKQGGLFSFPNFAGFDMSSPYTIIGGRLKARVFKGGSSRQDRVSISVSSPTAELQKSVWRTAEDAKGSIDVDVDLSEVLYPQGSRGRHEYTVQFDMSANEKNDPPTQSGVESVEFITDIQVASKSLPALAKGRNVIRYRDETPGPHKVKITHVWNERTDNNPPAAPVAAVSPKNAAVSNDLAPLFRWQASVEKDKQDQIENYEIKISLIRSAAGR